MKPGKRTRPWNVSVDITWDDAPVEQNAVINTDYKIRCVVRAQPPATIDWLKEDLIISTGKKNDFEAFLNFGPRSVSQFWREKMILVFSSSYIFSASIIKKPLFHSA